MLQCYHASLFSSLAVLWLLTPTIVPAQQAQSLAILDLEASGISAIEATSLTNRLRNALVRIGTITVVERGQMEQILGEQDFQLTGCTSNECAVEVGQLLGVTTMVAGSIGRVGSTYSIDIRSIDVQSGRITHSLWRDYRGEIDELLGIMPEVAEDLVSALMATEPSLPEVPPPASITVTTQPPGARIVLNGQEAGTTPLDIVELESDQSHTISLSLDGYQTVDTTLFAVAGRSYELSITLKRLPSQLTITSIPSGATVFLDNRRLRATPLSLPEVAPDRQHRLSLRLDGYQQADTTFFARAGEHHWMNIALQPVPVDVAEPTVQDAVLESEVSARGEELVTGIRRSQARSIAAKRQSAVVLDALSGDEMGQLPYQNLGEALRQLPGINTTGSAEEGVYDLISIRGAPARLNKVSINGQDLASSAESRAVGLDLVPSSLVEGVEVVKTTTPDMDGNAVGGMVNIRTITAFNRNEPFLYGSFHGRSYDSKFDYGGSSPDFRANVAFGRRLTPSLGITVAGEAFLRQFVSAGAWIDSWASDEVDGEELFFPSRTRTVLENHDRKRYSFNGTLDFRPSDFSRTYLHFNHFISDGSLERNQYMSRLYSPIEDTYLDGDPYDVTYVRAYGCLSVVSSSFDNPGTYDTEQLTMLTLGGENRSSALELEGAATYTQGIRNRSRGEYHFDGQSNYDMTRIIYFPERSDWSTSPFQEYVGDYDADDPDHPLKDPAGYRLRWFRSREYNNDEKTIIAEARAKYNTGFGAIKVGVKFRQTDKVIDDNTLYLWSVGEMYLDHEDFATDIPGDLTMGSGIMVVGDAAEIEEWMYDYLDANRNDINANADPLFINRSTKQDSINGDSHNIEQITAGYLMGELDLGKLHVAGGVRVEQTAADITHTLRERLREPHMDVDTTIWKQVQDQVSYMNVLPSVHIRFNVTDNLVFRGSFSSAISRPDFEELGGYERRDVYADVDGDGNFLGTYSGGIYGGNPELKPWRTNNFDVGAEYYAGLSMFTVEAFYKQIMDPIYEESWTSFDTTVAGRTFSYLDCSNMQNAKGAYVSGLELSVSTPLPAQLHNFGVVGSVTFMESQAIYTYGSSIENEGSLFWIRELEDTLRISGQPDLTWSLMPYFQMGRLQARLMATYQGDYLDYAGSLASYDRYVFERFNLDASVRCQILPNLALTLQARNITNEPLVRRYLGIPERLDRNYYQGRIFILEATFSL